MKSLLYDYLLVEEVFPNTTLEGTTLKRKYDDSERFMFVKVIQTSEMLQHELLKTYKTLDAESVTELINRYFKEGSILIINRVAKTPYTDGTYFVSIKDVIGVTSPENFD